MELLNPNLVVTFMKYGAMALVFGFITIVPIELIIYGVMKAISWFRPVSYTHLTLPTNSRV